MQAELFSIAYTKQITFSKTTPTYVPAHELLLQRVVDMPAYGCLLEFEWTLITALINRMCGSDLVKLSLFRKINTSLSTLAVGIWPLHEEAKATCSVQ